MNFSLPRFARHSALLLPLVGAACAPFSAPTYGPGVANEADATPATLADECAAGLCVDDEALDRMLAAQAALESCVPNDEDDFVPGEAEGLAIADITVAEDDAGWRVDVLLANTAPAGIWSYPSTLLEVVEGDALVATDYGSPVTEGGAVAEMQLYGIMPCSAETHSYRVLWSDNDSAVLIANALHNLGDDSKDSVKIALVRE